MVRRRIELPIIGMHCAGCAATVERTLQQRVPGVLSATVNLATDSAIVEYDAARTGPEQMAEAVAAAGYRIVLPAEGESAEDAEAEARRREQATQRLDFRVGLAFTIPLFLLSMLRDFHVLGAGHSARLSIGSSSCSRRRSSSTPAAASTAVPGPACAIAGPTWTCWWRSAPRRPTSTPSS